MVSMRTQSGSRSLLHLDRRESGKRATGGEPHERESVSREWRLLFCFIASSILCAMKGKGKKDLTARVTTLHVVVLAVNVLGGTSRAVDTEDVAVMANQLVPGMFAWRKYPEQINLELVRVTLSAAKSPRYGAMVSGSGREGWRLTSAGVSWISSRGEELVTSGLIWDPTRRTAGSIDTVHKDRELGRLKASEAWRKWCNDTPIELTDARWLFRVDGFTSASQMERKFVRLKALFTDDKDVSRFLDCASALLSREGGGCNG